MGRADPFPPSVRLLRAARGNEDCVQIIDATEFPGTPLEDAVGSIRLSHDGGTLSVNNFRGAVADDRNRECVWR
jgi:hypothetical protein